jgi:recombination protein RecA
MPTAATLRIQIESTLADRVPSALTPAHRVIWHVVPIGLISVDGLLEDRPGPIVGR